MRKFWLMTAAIGLAACGAATETPPEAALISTPQGPVQGVKTDSPRYL